jgi:2-amino-4-hydroxy-6-hydroxymethyldihydropteridine diphosphokinase
MIRSLVANASNKVVTRVVLSLGANLGSPLDTLRDALRKISLLGEGFQASKFYKNPAVSVVPQPNFLNCACLFDTKMRFNQLIPILEGIEIELGKVPKPKCDPRRIDIDLIFFGEYTFSWNGWEVPHPEWRKRLFVLLPLSDLLEEVVVEGQKWKIQELIGGFTRKEIEALAKLICPAKSPF